MISSMSRSGNCLDNAVAERFFHTLKSECLVNWADMPGEEVRRQIVDYIEMFYNSERLHSNALTGPEHNPMLSELSHERKTNHLISRKRIKEMWLY